MPANPPPPEPDIDRDRFDRRRADRDGWMSDDRYARAAPDAPEPAPADPAGWSAWSARPATGRGDWFGGGPGGDPAADAPGGGPPPAGGAPAGPADDPFADLRAVRPSSGAPAYPPEAPTGSHYAHGVQYGDDTRYGSPVGPPGAGGPGDPGAADFGATGHLPIRPDRGGPPSPVPGAAHGEGAAHGDGATRSDSAAYGEGAGHGEDAARGGDTAHGDGTGSGEGVVGGDGVGGSAAGHAAGETAAYPATDADGTESGAVSAVPEPPAGSRVGSLLTGLAAVLLFGVLAAGGHVGRDAELAGCVLVQLVFVGSWVIGTRRPGPLAVTVVGVGCGLAADAYAAFGDTVSLAPLGYVLAAGMLVGAAAQLARGARRSRVTDSLAATLAAVLGTVAVPTLVVLHRHHDGSAALLVTLAAGGAAVALARLLDVVWPTPRASLRVPRGAVGMAAGGVIASAAAGYLAGLTTDLVDWRTAVVGLLVGLAAVLTDVGVSFGSAGRQLIGETADRWPARYLLGPAAAAAVTGLAGYVLSVLVLLR